MTGPASQFTDPASFFVTKLNLPFIIHNGAILFTGKSLYRGKVMVPHEQLSTNYRLGCLQIVKIFFKAPTANSTVSWQLHKRYSNLPPVKRFPRYISHSHTRTHPHTHQHTTHNNTHNNIHTQTHPSDPHTRSQLPTCYGVVWIIVCVLSLGD